MAAKDTDWTPPDGCWTILLDRAKIHIDDANALIVQAALMKGFRLVEFIDIFKAKHLLVVDNIIDLYYHKDSLEFNNRIDKFEEHFGDGSDEIKEPWQR